mgnify:CR=1 FL=1
MRDYVIVTDSCVDLNQDQVEDMGLTVVPLSVQFGAQHFYNRPGDGPDPKEFFDRLMKGESAQTSAPNVDDFKENFRPLLQEGKDLLYLAFSSGLSATYQNGCIALDDLREEFPEAKIYAVDTLCASMGQGLIVYLADQEKRKGKTIEEVRDFVEANKLKVCHWFTVGHLTQLRRGGRLSAGKAVFGSLLQVKPILHVDNDGHLAAVTTVKGRKKSIEALADKIETLIENPEGQYVFISQAQFREETEVLAAMIKKRLPVADVIIGDIGPVIGTHTGQGVIAMFFMGKDRRTE